MIQKRYAWVGFFNLRGMLVWASTTEIFLEGLPYLYIRALIDGCLDNLAQLFRLYKSWKRGMPFVGG